MYSENHQYDFHGFEQQPLVSTGTSKVDIDSFLATARSKQRQYFLVSTVVTLLSLAFGAYLFSQVPSHFSKQPLSNFTPIGGQCQTTPFAGWFFAITHALLMLVPTLCWADCLRQFVSSTPGQQNNSVLVFKPHFIRNTTDKHFTAPDTYMQRIRSRAMTMIHTGLISTAIFSLVGLTGTLAMAPSTLCISSFSPLRYAYIAGLAAFSVMFIAGMSYMVVQRRKQMMQHIGTTTSSLDHYHPI